MTAPSPRLRLPRHSVRLRLMLVYGGLILLSGAALLFITYELVAHSYAPQVVTVHDGEASGTGQAGISACLPSPGSVPTPTQVSGCASYLRTQGAQEHAAELRQLLTESGIGLAILTVASIGLGWLVAGRVLRPLRTITAATRRISASSLHERLALAGPDDELKELGDTFDELLSRLEGAFGAQRQFVANASHELRTPLARQRTLVEVALADPEPSVGSLRSVCERVLAAGQQQERLIEALLTLARSQRGLDRKEPIDLAVSAGEVLRPREDEAARRELTITANLDAAPAQGDGRLTERLIANLLENALRYNQPGGWVQVMTGTQQGHALLAIANSGPVIPAAEMSRLFQPFQQLGTGRTGRDSPGLGLSIVVAITEAHHARLRARALPGGGLDVQIRFPLLPAGPLPGAGLPPAAGGPPRSIT
jgi:signal transduction histidine kinase